MKKKTKRVAIFSGLMIALGLALFLLSNHVLQHKGEKPTEATVFFHGYGSSRNAEITMSEYLIRKKYSNRIINLTVTKTGKVDVGGKVRGGDLNPIYLVQFDDNRNTDFSKTNQWVTTIMTRLHRQGIKSVNLIGHSMGNMAIVYYFKNHIQPNNDLPKVNREIDIAGHFNSLGKDPSARSTIDATGKPSQESDSFKALKGLEKYYQNNPTKVLNIYGNSTGASESDTTVPNNSSRTLKYFVQSPSSYQEKLITGKNAQHSKLHENQEVNQLIYQFLQTGK